MIGYGEGPFQTSLQKKNEPLLRKINVFEETLKVSLETFNVLPSSLPLVPLVPLVPVSLVPLP